jgi:hypothetical protein
MAPNLVTSIDCQKKCSDSRSVACNLSQYLINYKEYDKLGRELLEIWRRPANTGGGLQTYPNYRIYMGESAHKSNLKFNSSPIWNPTKINLKTQGVLGLIGKIRRLSFQNL